MNYCPKHSTKPRQTFLRDKRVRPTTMFSNLLITNTLKKTFYFLSNKFAI